MRRISFSSAGIHNHRRDRRMTLLQLVLQADGMEFDSTDWGLGGIRIEGQIPDRQEEDSLRIVVSGERKGQHLSIDVMATIVRIDKLSNETALRFDDLSAEDLDVLEALITGRRISA